MKFVPLFLTLLFLVACTEASEQSLGSVTSSAQNLPIVTAVAGVPTSVATVAATEVATDVVALNSQDFLWNCYACGGPQIWRFEDGEASQVDLPVELGWTYGYTPATGKVLYAAPKEAIGGGPSQISVHDLWVLDVASGEAEAIYEEPVVVEAVWSPDGEHFAYILATDTTYELRWHGPNDEDKLLASDVAFTFSVSSNGDKVAFTRESNYGLPGQPGLFVVDVATGEELMISDVDRAGSGSISDQPVWSPSGDYLLLPYFGSLTPGGYVMRAMADGSNSVALQYDPSLADEEWYESQPFIPFAVSDDQIISSQFSDRGPQGVILYQLNETRDTIVNGVTIGEGTVVDWDVPGESIWLWTPDGMESVPLPEL